MPFRILLVEDDDEVAEHTAELLRDIGLQVLRVSDDKPALATFRRDPTIAMAMWDIVMPGGTSGLDLARTLQELHPELPVLLATGHSQYALEAVKQTPDNHKSVCPTGDRRRLGPQQAVFFTFYAKRLRGRGVGSRSNADSHLRPLVQRSRRDVEL